VSRAAGLVAFALVAASVISGLVLANRLGSRAVRARLRELHEPLAVVALVALAVHGLVLLADPWLAAGPLELMIPFTLRPHQLWTGLGVIAGWLALALGLSFYARRRLGARRWRAAHRLMPAVYALGLAHALGAGSEASTVAMRALGAGTAIPVCALLALRIAPRRAKTSVAPVSAEPERTARARLAPASAKPVPPERTAGSLWLGRST
jgi:sulfoxide reductase heme-binding subunit YedZ